MNCANSKFTVEERPSGRHRLPKPEPGVLEGLRRLGRGGPDLAVEEVEVVADGHGEGEQFFEGLLGVVEGNGDAAGFEADAGGEVLQFLREDLNRGLDQKLGPFQLILMQLGEDAGDLAAALELIKAVLAFGQAAQAGDQLIAIGQPARSNAIGDAGGHDLLGAAAADAEEEFDRRAIDERTGLRAQHGNRAIEFVVPGGFSGHTSLGMLVRVRAKYKGAKDR
jgi:hypothetical protein